MVLVFSLILPIQTFMVISYGHNKDMDCKFTPVVGQTQVAIFVHH